LNRYAAWRSWTGSVLVTLSLFALWWLVSTAGWISRVFLPSPLAAGAAMLHGLFEGDLAWRTLATLQRMVVGWLLASLLGVLLGTLVAASQRARRWLLPLLELLRPLPASALLPAGIALMGLTSGMVLAAVAFGAMWPVLLATVHGVGSVDERLREVARLLRLSRPRFVATFGLPNALPDIVAGMRLSMTASLIVALVGEMVAAQEGLGTEIMTAARRLRSDDLYAGVMLLGAIGLLSNALLALAERRLIRWRPH
jgi:sulfonate transport system permease protein